MARSLVRVGDVEPFEFDDKYGTTRPTDYEVRAFIYESGVKKYDNGSDFTATDALIASTFSSGVCTGAYTFPSYALGKVVHIEGKPIGIPLDPYSEEYFVSENLDDDVMQAISTIQGALSG